MPAWAISLIIQAGEAIIFGVGATAAAHQAGADWQTALIAGLSAAIGKVAPSQILPGAGTPAPPPPAS